MTERKIRLRNDWTGQTRTISYTAVTEHWDEIPQQFKNQLARRQRTCGWHRTGNHTVQVTTTDHTYRQTLRVLGIAQKG